MIKIKIIFIEIKPLLMEKKNTITISYKNKKKKQ